MKPLIILSRIALVGLIWSVFFIEGTRVILLRNWHFDMFRTSHWQYAWDLWLSGWVINDAKEWAFILIIITFVPLWFTGWVALSLIKWEKIIKDLAFSPLQLVNPIVAKPVKIITNAASVKAVKKKRSYKEIRPRSLRPPLDESSYSPINNPKKSITAAPAKPAAPAPEAPKAFEHSLFQFDDSSDDFDFDIDAFDTDNKNETPASIPSAPEIEDFQPAPASNRNSAKRQEKSSSPAKPRSSAAEKAPASASSKPSSRSNSTMEVIKQKGYEIITNTTIKNTIIDFIGVADSQICICLNDKEPGDWLADEERFNDEEPLWFSESSHRISPVRKLDLARNALVEKLNSADLNFTVKAYVIEQVGNIINAEDMFDIWDDLDITVARIDRGTPKELKLFSKTLEEAITKVEKEKFEQVKKLVRSIV